MSPARILLIDPETLVRKALEALLVSHPGLEVIADLPDATEALAYESPEPPDVVLMELTHTGLTSASAVRRLSDKWPDCRFAFLTSRLDAESCAEWDRAHGHGSISKDSSSAELLMAIEIMIGGGIYGEPAVTPAKLKRGVLTPREREVLRLTAEGRSVKEVAHLLGLSAKTVDAHKVNLMRKLQIHKAQLVQYAFHNQILTLPPGPCNATA